MHVNEFEFARRFPFEPNQSLAGEMGISVSTVVRRARLMGIKKDKEYLRALRTPNLSAGRVGNFIHLRGESHYNWKGGRPWERFKDPRYIEWRSAVLARDGYICQDCHRLCRKSEKGLAAHHLKPYATHADLRYVVSNGITLCRQCHMTRHGRAPKIEMITCACGCGTMIFSRNPYTGRPRRYVNHHGGRALRSTKKRPRDDGRMVPCECGCGTLIKRIGAQSLPIRFAPGHGTRVRWATQEWQGVRRAEFGEKMSAARKREPPRARDKNGRFLSA